MKKTGTLLIAVILTSIQFMAAAQAPGLFNYQAVIRGDSGNVLANQLVYIRFQIYDASVAGNLVYQETITSQSNQNGVVNLQIGANGNVSLKSLNWGLVNYYINIEMSQTGNSYTPINANYTQLASVPYALYANRADTAIYATKADSASYAPTTNYTNGQGITINGDTIAVRDTTSQTITLSASGDSLIVSQGNNVLGYVNLSSLVPPGTIQAFGGTTIPTGWLLCDGGPQSINGMYHALFAAIGNAYGGNGTSSFNVPDFRGIFLRGAQMTLASGGDPDVNLRTVNGSNAKSYPGSTQTDAIQTHQHLANCNTYSNTGNGVGGAYTSSTANVVFGASNGVTYPSITTGPVSNNGNIQVSSETRPVNAYVNYIIKY